ncbi:hypothetical protein EVAR_62353_1 [Eumeta japonica]|uniref:N-acetyltransferase domain-containing protein n=1 Tax=Eumeta variegata TaxID=151549 RepID=A0A4C1ZR60_EUMVA|nr:hypothetical protein EVAR_62353_1 [Eumeta japonica]
MACTQIASFLPAIFPHTAGVTVRGTLPLRECPPLPGSLYEVIIFPNVENTDKLVDALVETQLIDWNRKVCIPFAEVDALRCLNRARRRIGLKIVRQVPTIKHFLAKDSEIYDVECPPETYFGPLKHEHVDQVDVAWPHRYETSKDFIRLLIDNDLTYGLFSTKDNSLIAWLLICEVGFLTHLYCEEKHRRRGYAETVLKYALNDQLKKGNDVFGYVLDDNLNSMKLFRKMDFEVIGRGIWTFVTKE